MTHALTHALLLVGALPLARFRVPRVVGLATLAGVHWLWVFAGPSHVALFVAAIAFWAPLVRGRAGPGYVLLALVLSDSAALAMSAAGRAADAVEMLAGMLPLVVAFVVVAWRRLREEEADARVAA